jgi:crotonobetainyl-CoA:carnitine CoA-transferase CaiB-like acyl-CoA transferase
MCKTLAPRTVISMCRATTLLGEHTTEVLSDWLGLDAAAIAQLRQDGIV